MNAKSSRNIKCIGSSFDKGEKYLHPITLQTLVNKTEYISCPSELHYDDNKLVDFKPYTSSDKLSTQEIQKFMALPYLNLDTNYILLNYKIESIDSLLLWVDNMMKADKPFKYINRIINIWIKINFDSLKENNKILVTLYEKLSSKYMNNQKVDLNNINKWFKTKKYDDFSFNLSEIFS
jgi:hypothetical protein